MFRLLPFSMTIPESNGSDMRAASVLYGATMQCNALPATLHWLKYTELGQLDTLCFLGVPRSACRPLGRCPVSWTRLLRLGSIQSNGTVHVCSAWWGEPAAEAAAGQLPVPGAAAPARPQAAHSAPAAARRLPRPSPSSVRLPEFWLRAADSAARWTCPALLSVTDPPPASGLSVAQYGALIPETQWTGTCSRSFPRWNRNAEGPNRYVGAAWDVSLQDWSPRKYVVFHNWKSGWIVFIDA